MLFFYNDSVRAQLLLSNYQSELERPPPDNGVIYAVAHIVFGEKQHNLRHLCTKQLPPKY